MRGVDKVWAHTLETCNTINTATTTIHIGRTGSTHCRGQQVIPHITLKTVRGIALVTIRNATSTRITRWPHKIIIAITSDTQDGWTRWAHFTAALWTLITLVVPWVEIVPCAALKTVGLGVAVDTALDHALTQVADVSGWEVVAGLALGAHCVICTV